MDIWSPFRTMVEEENFQVHIQDLVAHWVVVKASALFRAERRDY